MGTVRLYVRWVIVYTFLFGHLNAQNRPAGLAIHERADGTSSIFLKANGTLVYSAEKGEVVLLNEHVAKVFQNNHWYIVTGEEGFRSETMYSDIRSYSQEMVAFRKEGKWGYLDVNGKERIPALFSMVFDFKADGAVVFDGKQHQSE